MSCRFLVCHSSGRKLSLLPIYIDRMVMNCMSCRTRHGVVSASLLARISSKTNEM
jgi:hypothetical protein